MSRAFYHGFEIPPHSNWKTWIWRACGLFSKRTWAFVQGVAAIQRLSGLPWLPKDVWNLIIGHIFYRPILCEPQQWKGDYLAWLNAWLKDKSQHRQVALLLSRFHPDNPVYPHMEDVEVKDFGTQQPLVDLAFHPDTLDVVASVSEMRQGENLFGRFGNLLLGVQVIDGSAEDVLSCELFIGPTKIHTPFLFTSDYEVDMATLLEQRECFYFHPELRVIPISLLWAHAISIQLLLRPGSTIRVFVVQAFCSSVFRDGMSIYDKGLILNEPPAQPFCVTNGLGTYI